MLLEFQLESKAIIKLKIRNNASWQIKLLNSITGKNVKKTNSIRIFNFIISENRVEEA